MVCETEQLQCTAEAEEQGVFFARIIRVKMPEGKARMISFVS
jgi:hypothetical protein